VLTELAFPFPAKHIHIAYELAWLAAGLSGINSYSLGKITNGPLARKSDFFPKREIDILDAAIKPL
jgi:hypothetical protein